MRGRRGPATSISRSAPAGPGAAGPNGAGKTTTMLSLVGELAPIAGVVRFLGEAAAGPLHRRAKRGLSFVTEERSVFADLSVRRTSASEGVIPKRSSSSSPSSSAARTARGPALRRRAADAHAGRALARPGAKVLLADELSLGLAPKAVTRLLRAVRAAADRGTAVLLVEQHVQQGPRGRRPCLRPQPRPGALDRRPPSMRGARRRDPGPLPAARSGRPSVRTTPRESNKEEQG